jgi:hypothetical protein
MSTHDRRVVSWYFYFPITWTLMMLLVESLFLWLDWALTVAHGQGSNFTIFLPVSGLPLPLLAPCLSPHSFIRKLYKGEIGDFTVYQLLALSAATIASSPLHFWASSQPPSIASVDASRDSLTRIRWWRRKARTRRPAGCSRNSNNLI